MGTWIERTGRQTSLRVLVLNTLLLAFVFWILTLNRDYWGPFFHGPTAMTAEQLAALDPLHVPTTFAAVRGSRVLESGVQEVETNYGIQHVTAGYYGLLVADASGSNKLLMVKSGKPIPTTVSGLLTGMPYDLEQTLFEDDADGARRSTVYPLLLDTNYRESGYVGIFWGLLFFVWFGFYWQRALRRVLGMAVHPAVARAKGWGDLATVSNEVEREVQTGPEFTCKRHQFTQHYLVRKGWLHFDVWRFDDLLWAYKKATKRSINFIPTGTYYSAELNFADGAAAIPTKQKNVDRILQLVQELAPWAALGFTDQIAALYKNRRGEFVQYVQEQKAEMTKR